MKIEKIDSEIAKTEAIIAEQQGRLRELRNKRTEAENLEIIALVRSVNIPRTELAAALSAFRQGRAFPSYGKPDPRPDPETDTDTDTDTE